MQRGGNATPIDVETAVRVRYTQAARTPEESLCCPVRYDESLFAAIPHEALERDYGCGDPELWSGCVSSAFREDRFLHAFEEAGFYGLEILSRDERPWRTVEHIEFRGVTVVAHKREEGSCTDRGPEDACPPTRGCC